VTINNSAVEFL